MTNSPCPENCLECWLPSQLDRRSCDGSAALVEEWLTARCVPGSAVLRFLERDGGYCSCEVLMHSLDRGRVVLDDLVLACGR